MLNFVCQGSEIETVVYVVGLPFYQNCQHVYTAVTRGIRQVIIINNQSHLQRAIATPPDKRQTKLKEDLSDELEYGMICWSDENEDCLDDDSGVTVQDPSVPEEAPGVSVTESNSKTEAQSSVESSTGDQSHQSTTEPSNDFSISRENVRIKRMKQDQEKQHGTTATHTADAVSGESHQQLLQAASPVEVGDFQSPGKKRKHVGDCLIPPQTPPSLKNLPSSLSCVSPLSQSSSQTTEAVVSRPSSSTRLTRIQAEYPSWCRICKRSIHKGDDITHFYEGSIKRWIHCGCKPCE